jgi:hypothetical protein
MCRTASAPWMFDVTRLNALPHFHLSTLRRPPYGRPRMTRVHRDWLGLQSTELPSATACRFRRRTEKVGSQRPSLYHSNLPQCSPRQPGSQKARRTAGFWSESFGAYIVRDCLVCSLSAGILQSWGVRLFTPQLSSIEKTTFFRLEAGGRLQRGR